MKTKIIDRTIPAMQYGSSVKSEELWAFCRILKALGVDLIEIKGDLPGKLPAGIDFLYRLESARDADVLRRHKIKHCVADREMLRDTGTLRKLGKHGTMITLECRVDGMEGLQELEKLQGEEGIRWIKTLRLTGLDLLETPQWTEIAVRIGKMRNISIDVCPENRFYHATALALEAVMGGMDFVTLSFAGYGERAGYGALEEVLAAVRVLANPCASFNLGLLPELGRLFSRITGVPIPGTKPVIGEGIFGYESGIHADGIEKNPATYEPFEPYMVGLRRKLHIGKHSGTKAVIRKLEELGIGCGAQEAAAILEIVRKKSIQLKRSLDDEEIRELCGVVL